MPWLGLLAATLPSGCGGADAPRAEQAAVATATVTPEPAQEPAPTARLGEPVVVASTANVYGAGREEPPAPAGKGPGDLPVELLLPKRARTVRVTQARGEVTPLSDGEGTFAPAGAEGSETSDWKMPGVGGISGLGHRDRRMFLAGVFLGAGPPGGRPPKALNYGKRVPARQSPQIAQAFLVGGRGRAFRVPKGATRLFLGFADFIRGASHLGPGDYTNNRGELTVTLEAG